MINIIEKSLVLFQGDSVTDCEEIEMMNMI